jgi:hypothetical protein
MYSRTTAASVMRNLGSNEDTPQPLNLHGWSTGTWPTTVRTTSLPKPITMGPTIPFGPGLIHLGLTRFTAVGSFNLNTATGITAGMPVIAAVQSAWRLA